MRLATFNLLHGRSLTDGVVDAARLLEAIQTLDVDVIALQEVDRSQPRSGGLDLTRVVAEAVCASDDNWRFAPALIGEPGAAWRAATAAEQAVAGRHRDHRDGTGHDAPTPGTPHDAPTPGTPHDAPTPGTPHDAPAYGIGLVSRLPVSAWHLVRLSPARVRSPVLLPGSRRVAWLSDEPRLGLAGVVETEFGPLTVASTHLSFVPGWNAVQLRRLVASLTGLPSPHVLLGDLNMPGPFPRWLSGWRPLASDKTYPAWRPSIQIDHALGHGLLPKVLSTQTLQLPLSDHRALVVELADTLTP